MYNYRLYKIHDFPWFLALWFITKKERQTRPHLPSWDPPRRGCFQWVFCPTPQVCLKHWLEVLSSIYFRFLGINCSLAAFIAIFLPAVATWVYTNDRSNSHSWLTRKCLKMLSSRSSIPPIHLHFHCVRCFTSYTGECTPSDLHIPSTLSIEWSHSSSLWWVVLHWPSHLHHGISELFMEKSFGNQLKSIETKPFLQILTVI